MFNRIMGLAGTFSLAACRTEAFVARAGENLNSPFWILRADETLILGRAAIMLSSTRNIF